MAAPTTGSPRLGGDDAAVLTERVRPSEQPGDSRLDAAAATTAKARACWPADGPDLPEPRRPGPARPGPAGPVGRGPRPGHRRLRGLEDQRTPGRKVILDVLKRELTDVDGSDSQHRPARATSS